MPDMEKLKEIAAAAAKAAQDAAPAKPDAPTTININADHGNNVVNGNHNRITTRIGPPDTLGRFVNRTRPWFRFGVQCWTALFTVAITGVLLDAWLSSQPGALNAYLTAHDPQVLRWAAATGIAAFGIVCLKYLWFDSVRAWRNRRRS